MKTHEIEDWALRIIQCVRSGANVEDARTELKRELIEPEKAARRIAGHANSARGEPILWVIGVDEKTRELFDVESDTAAWWSSVQARFDGVSPTLTDVAFSVDGKSLRALFFDTDRRPFVVKAYGSSPQWEVPWRDGTRTRSAVRNELVQLLAPVARLPSFEILTGTLAVEEMYSGATPVFQFKLNLQIYVLPKTDARLVFPFHRVSCMVGINGTSHSLAQITLDEVNSHRSTGAHGGDSHATIRASASELIVTGPGSFHFRAGCATDSQGLAVLASQTKEAIITVTILPVNADRSAILEIPLRQIAATGRDLVAFRHP